MIEDVSTVIGEEIETTCKECGKTCTIPRGEYEICMDCYSELMKRRGFDVYEHIKNGGSDYHVQRKRNQEKREKRESTKNSNREQQTEKRNIERFIKNQGREIHSNKLKKSVRLKKMQNYVISDGNAIEQTKEEVA